MRLIALATLSTFWKNHPETRSSLERWAEVVRSAAWQATSEVQASFPKAKVLNAERIRFEVAGGAYRLIAAFNFAAQIVFVKFIGSHAQYDRVDALTISLF